MEVSLADAWIGWNRYRELPEGRGDASKPTGLPGFVLQHALLERIRLEKLDKGTSEKDAFEVPTDPERRSSWLRSYQEARNECLGRLEEAVEKKEREARHSGPESAYAREVAFVTAALEGTVSSAPLTKRTAPGNARLMYFLDNFFAINPASKFIFLLVVTGSMIGTGSFLFWGASDDTHYFEAMWIAWTFIADPGTHTEQEEVSQRAVGALLSIGGMLFFALLVGLIGEQIVAKVDALKKGRSRVLERNHTLIFGWTDKSIACIRQLILANESEGGGVIVVMAPMDKEVMDQMLTQEIIDRKGTKIVTRNGNPIDIQDLRRVSVCAARSILVLSPVGCTPDEADAQVVRTTLALSSFELTGHIVVELCDIDNLDILTLAVLSANVKVIPLVAHDIIGRVMIQCSREPGLAQVFQHLLMFDLNEIYMAEWPQLVGKTFEDAIFCFEDAVPIGVKYAAHGERVLDLNPPGTYVIQEGDSIIVVAEDNDSYYAGPKHSYDPGPHPPGDVPLPPQEKILFCGWRRDIDDMIAELDDWVAPDSQLTIVSTKSIEDRMRILEEGDFQPTRNLVIKHIVGDPTLRRVLLDPALPLEEFDCALVLSDETWFGEEKSGMSADSRAMVAMLLIRDIQKKLGKKKKTVLIAEILDSRTEALMNLANCSDYVVSNVLISMVLTQVCEQPDMEFVVDSLFNSEGQEMHIKPSFLYVRAGERLCYWELLQRSRGRGHIAIGYRMEGERVFILNPKDKMAPILWGANDQVVVVSEN